MKRTNIHLWLIRFIGLLVPRRLRADWRQEWEAELQYREEMLAEWERLTWRNKLDLLRRSMSAFWDAMVLQPKRWEDEMMQDLRFGMRMLLKHKGFTFIAVLTLALGIGANTAIFSVVNAVILRPLPYQEPERLVRFWESNPGRGWTEFAASAPNFVDWRQQQAACEQLAAYEFNTFNFTGSGEPERVASVSVTANFFSVLGVLPAYGRNFLPEDEQAGRYRVAVLSYGLWQRRFGADPNSIGRQIQLNGESYTIVGVMPSGFQFTKGTELWVPLTLDPAVQSWRADRSNHNLSVFGRLKPGVSLVQAQAAMDIIARRLEQQHPKSNTGWGVRMSTFHDWLVPEPIQRSVLVLFAAVGFLLLIACANVANLLLVRASARQREMAIRVTLGASRWRVMRQLLTESVMLSLLGGLVGALLAFGCTGFIKASTSLKIPRLEETRLDMKALGFTILMALLTGLIFGLAPAGQASGSALNESLKEGGRSGSGGKSQRLRSALVIAEVALALVLLVGAGLMIRSFTHLQNVPLGFAPENVLTMQLALPTAKYGQGAPGVNFFEQLLQRLRAFPGVIDASAITVPPLAGGGIWAEEITLEGGDTAQGGTPLPADVSAVTPRYFHTMGIPLLAGRDFTEQDRGAYWLGEAPFTLIVNETFARRYWPNENPLGKRFRIGGDGNPFGTVIGVVGDVRTQSLEKDARPAFFYSYGHLGMPALTVVVRTSTPPETMTAALRAQVNALDSDLPVYNIRPLQQIVANAAEQSRFQTLLLGLFGAVALLLAAIGIYGVMAYTVTQRMHELGVRMALGANTRDVLKLIVHQGMKLAALGIALGLLGALSLTRLLTTLLYAVSATDPLTLSLVTLLLASVVWLACWIPARRATKVDPLSALRQE